MVRKVDELGRIVIPKEIRRQLEVIDNKDSLEIFVEGDSVILKKYNPGCRFCGSMSNVKNYQEHRICTDCARKIGSIKGV
jgi:transcriptional pleiotropic regulator of transition state genes